MCVSHLYLIFEIGYKWTGNALIRNVLCCLLVCDVDSACRCVVDKAHVCPTERVATAQHLVLLHAAVLASLRCHALNLMNLSFQPRRQLVILASVFPADSGHVHHFN